MDLDYRDRYLSGKDLDALGRDLSGYNLDDLDRDLLSGVCQVSSLVQIVGGSML